MPDRRLRYTLTNAIAWAAALQEAMDEGRPLPLMHKVPGFTERAGPAALSHWAEYTRRAINSAGVDRGWISQFDMIRNSGTLDEEFDYLVGVLRCVQRELDGESGKLTLDHLYAAEIFSYSFANYRDHLGIGHIRFEELMPGNAGTLRKAVAEGWPIAKVAEAIDVDTDNAAHLLAATRDAIDVLEAATPADSFRHAIRQLVDRAVTTGFDEPDAIEDLVTQICYRVSDFSCLLEREGSPLSRYCRDLRKEPDSEGVDDIEDLDV